MVYLCKEARRNTILEAAARIARREGLAATTVRRVAQEAQHMQRRGRFIIISPVPPTCVRRLIHRS